MNRFLKYLVCSLVFLISGLAAVAQGPKLVKFDSTTDNGRYKTGQVIELEAQFDDWLGLGTSVKVLLNNGEVVELTFDPKKSTDLLDADFGVKGQKNASNVTYTDYSSYYGFSCILELEGKGDYISNKGMMVLSGGFDNYEGTGNDDFVVLDNNGREVKLGYGNRRANYLDDEVRWVIETQDGGLLLGGEFADFMDNDYYDGLVKLKGDFTIDHEFMNNLTKNGTKAALDNSAGTTVIGARATDFGRPGFCMVEDAEGNIYFAGAFTHVSGVSHRGVAKIDKYGNYIPEFNPGYYSGWGSSLAIDGDYLWVGNSMGYYNGEGTHWNKSEDKSRGVDYDYFIDRISTTTGKRDSNYTPPKQTGSFYGVLGIAVMPEYDASIPNPIDRSPGGVLVTGRFHGGVEGHEYGHIVSLQDDGSVTPRDRFDITCNDVGRNVSMFFQDGETHWAVDGFDILKNKIWIGVHESQYNAQETKNSDGIAARYFKGALAVLNMNGTAAYDFNQMLVHDKRKGDLTVAASGFHGGAFDILSVYVDKNDRLLVGGNYRAFMENDYDDSGDDDFITRLSFTRATGSYTVKSTDLVSNLEILGIVDSNVTGAFGDEGSVGNFEDLPKFSDEHNISLNMPVALPPTLFVFEWDVTAGEEMQLPNLSSNISNYNIYVDWGEGSTVGGVHYDDIPNFEKYSNSFNIPKHTYSQSKKYVVKILADTGNGTYADGVGLPTFGFDADDTEQAKKITRMIQWGNIKWSTLEGVFYNCENMLYEATDVPTLANTVTLTNAFNGAKKVNFNIDNWDVSKITSMIGMFMNADAFNNGNEPGVAGVMNWGNKTSALQTAASMFKGAKSFNQDVTGWNVSNLKSSKEMFHSTTSFNNGEVGNTASKPFSWNMSAVTDASYMFAKASVFNQKMLDSDLSNVTDLTGMFNGASLFNNGDTGNTGANPIVWNTTKNKSTSGMFNAATSFNQKLELNTASVTNMSSMFAGASLFNNGEIGNESASPLTFAGGTANLTNMQSMFNGAVKFNQNFSNLQTDKVTSMASTFNGASLFNQDISTWQTSAVTSMASMFQNAAVFDQNISNWSIAKLTTAENMLNGAKLSQNTYDRLLVSWLTQVNAGASKTVKFHGGASQYCLGALARRTLIDYGWGDGIAGGSYENTSTEGIINGTENCGGQFITEWIVPTGGNITIKRNADNNAAMTVDWGDGVVSFDQTGDVSHTYATSFVGKTVTIKMQGEVSMYWTTASQSIVNLQSVIQFGNIEWKSMKSMFAHATNMTFADGIDTPNLSNVTSMASMFYGASAFNSPLTDWNTTNVTDMSLMFKDAISFNQDLKNLNTANVTNMTSMFQGATKFNQDLNSWNTANVTNMTSMFEGATAFNANVDNFNVEKVTKMYGMFKNATSFDRDLTAWKIKSLENYTSGNSSADDMFQGVTLSTSNYDALLISFATQVQEGNANKTIRFDGGNSRYCAATAERAALVAQGWTIYDAGSAAPATTGLTFTVNDLESGFLAQGKTAVFQFTGTTAGVKYIIENLETNAKFAAVASSTTLSISTDKLFADASYRIYALAADDFTNENCPASITQSTEVKVYQVLDPCLTTVQVTTGLETKIANGVDLHTIKITALDLLGEPIASAKIKTQATENANFTQMVVYTDASGVATLTVNSTVAAKYTTIFKWESLITGTTYSIPSSDVCANTNIGLKASYEFVADVPVIYNSSLVKKTNNGELIANNVDKHIFEAKLFDNKGNAVKNYEINFRATTNVNFSYVNALGQTVNSIPGVNFLVKTDDNGEVTVYATSTEAWTMHTTYASFIGTTGETLQFATSPLKYDYIAGNPDLDKSSIVAEPTSQKTGSTINLTITLLDAFSNPLRNTLAVFRQAKQNGTTTDLVTYDGSIAKKEKYTNNDGKATVVARSEKKGTYTTEGTVKINNVEVTNGKTVSYDFTASDPIMGKDYSRAELITNNATNDGDESNMIRATILDAYNNPVNGAKVKIDADQFINWGSGYNRAHEIFANASGVAEFNGVSTTQGTYTTKVWVENTSGTYEAVYPEAGLTHNFVAKSAGAVNSKVTITESPATADGLDYVVATIELYAADRDGEGNLVPVLVPTDVIVFKTNHVTATVESGDALEVLPNGNWKITVTDGTAVIHAKSKVQGKYETKFGINEGGVDVTFDTAKYEFIAGKASAVNSVVTLTVNNQLVNNNNEISVQLYDDFGDGSSNNPITSLTEAVDILFAATPGVSINGGAVGASYTKHLNVGEAGNFKVTLTSAIAGQYSTLVTMGGANLGGDNPAIYNFRAGSPSLNKSYYEVSKNGATANNTDVVTIKAHIFDTNGNPVQGINVRYSNEHTAENCLTIGELAYPEGRAVTDANGVAVMNITSTTIGRYNSWVAFTNNGDWTDASFVGNNLPATQGGTPSKAPFYFVDEYTKVDQAKNVAIRAKWYVVQQADAPSHTVDDVKTQSGLKAWYLTGVVDYIDNNNINLSSISSLKSAVVGPYSITLSNSSTGISTSVVASVVNDLTVYSETEELAIYAQDYQLSGVQAQNHQASNTIEAANSNAKAWSLSEGTDFTNLTYITPSATHLAAINTGADNSYPLDLKLSNGTNSVTRTVTVTVISDNSWFITTWDVNA
ncbi:MAG: BspA family leucine-rich repeat surface protein, partial [Mangrovibacterium sp.]